MVQRYRNQINEAATPAAFGRNYVDGAATGVSVAGAIAGAGDELRRFAEVRKRQQDEWDAATVMNAQTEYARQMAEWMDDPETGKLQTRKLGAARGLTDETFRYADELAKKIAGGLENENQKAAFLRIAERVKLPYWKQASEYEGEDPPGQPEPLQPLPDRRGQGVQAPAAPRQKRSKMIPDGTPYDPPAPSGHPPLQGGKRVGLRLSPPCRESREGTAGLWGSGCSPT